MTARRWLLATGSVLTAVLLALSVANATAVVVRQEAIEQRSLPGAGLIRVEVRAEGPVLVRGSDRRDVAVVAHLAWSFTRPALTVKREGETAIVSASCPLHPVIGCRAALVVTVPRALAVAVSVLGGDGTVDGVLGDLDLEAAGGGLTVRAAGGAVRARSHGGDLDVSGVAGRLDLDSSGGGITASRLRSAQVTAVSRGGSIRLTFTVPPDDVRATSYGGDTTVLLPRGEEAYEVQTDVLGGDADVRVLQDGRSERVLRLTGRGGGVSVDYAR